jgi:hypothetical protein
MILGIQGDHESLCIKCDFLVFGETTKSHIQYSHEKRADQKVVRMRKIVNI